ncbi:hypothetical protein N7U66_09990 [Lacinutrix neustonica]|uniref:Uncharacterized protein n=1 Tax=Lacinutrix neustonica TaxID=2980107 RepID=A0A9E8N0R0_9FLAO|nr:hypothetical protein [Lacinutrix neustonica]WAC03720.1 hypothetical protein N7U66_09990 [Lacinutrix neustonica]
MPTFKNGYKGWMDSIIKVKLKKNLVNQPSYNVLGLDSTNSKNVDVSLRAMIQYYETNFKKIILEPCDFETSIFEESSCRESKKDKVFKEEVIIKYRNTNIVNNLKKDTLSKIAIIYGADHFTGIKEQLLSIGYN